MTDYVNLDWEIRVERSTATPNDLNEDVTTWDELGTFFASREDVSDGEKLAAGQVGSFLRSRFVIRRSDLAATVTPMDRIIHECGIWSIHGIKETVKDGRRRFREITAVRDADAPQS